MKMQYSAAELVAMRLDGYPATEQNMSKRAASENWRFVEVAARGGKNGTRREYPLNQPALKHLIPQIQDLAVAKFLKEFSHGIKTAAKSGQPDAGIGAGTPADDVEMSAKSTPASVTAAAPTQPTQ